MTDPPRRVEQAYAYPAELLTRYREGRLFREWCERYPDALLFCERMWGSRQIPHSGPISNVMFFHEFFLGTRYVEAGYGVLFFYRQVEDEACYRKACEILGGEEAARFITPNNERGGRAPDLLVYDPRSLCFRFVECKGKAERYTANQPGRFAEIEEYLNSTLPHGSEPLTDSRHGGLFPRLGPGQWIHVARLEPR
jgi:hypothetical protein